MSVTLLLLLLASDVFDLRVQAQTQGNDFFPAGRRFPCSAYSIGASDGKLPGDIFGPNGRWGDIEQAKAQGIEIIGPQYELNDTVAEDASVHHLSAIYSVGVELDFDNWTPSSADLDRIYANIAEQVKRVAHHRHIVWWNLINEELRHWRPAEMAYLKTVSRAVTESDPLQRPLAMYEPGHRVPSDLVTTGRHLGMIAMGVYVNYGGFANQRTWVAVAMQRQKAAAEMLGGKPVIFIPEMFANPPPNSPITSWATHDVVRALAEGAQGITIFSFRRRLGFTEYDTYREAYAKVLRLVCGDAPLGQALLFGAATAAVSTDPKPDAVQIFHVAQGTTVTANAVGFRAVHHRDTVFILIVNSTGADVDLSVHGVANEARVHLSSGATFQPTDKRLRLAPWGAVVLSQPGSPL